jgi:small subunit ribosomal protein S6
MRKYEMMLLLSPELGSEERQAIIDMVAGVIEADGGSMIEVNEKDWGLRELAYPVKKQSRGYYILFTFAVPGQAVAELERKIRITDGVFKFVTVKLDDKYEEEAA